MRPDVFFFFTALLLLFFLLVLKTIERKKGRTVLFPGLRRWADNMVIWMSQALRNTARSTWHKIRHVISGNVRRHSEGLRTRLIRLLDRR